MSHIYIYLEELHFATGSLRRRCVAGRWALVQVRACLFIRAQLRACDIAWLQIPHQRWYALPGASTYKTDARSPGYSRRGVRTGYVDRNGPCLPQSATVQCRGTTVHRLSSFPNKVRLCVSWLLSVTSPYAHSETSRPNVFRFHASPHVLPHCSPGNPSRVPGEIPITTFSFVLNNSWRCRSHQRH